tara:strand:- start:661 stop:1083 length:423 start_codon:yes stop_codon:yes gene_type:complete
MIKYNLKCCNNHEFESWFSSSEEFDKLRKKDLLDCIYCSSKKINKSIMSPMISNAKNKAEEIDILNKNFDSKKNELLKLKHYIEKNFEYVGKDFSKRVREIYYDKKNEKGIYGTTTYKEREELAEEGIDLLSIPWVNKDN